MKRLFASFLSLSLFLVSCSLPPIQSTPATSTPTPAPTLNDPMQTPWDDRSIFSSGLVRSEQGVLDGLGYASIYHLDFEIADDLYHVTGMEEVRYTNDEKIALNEIRFRLFPNILGGEMTVTNITVNGKPAVPSYGLQNSLMTVPLPQPLEPGKSVVVKMEYTVTVPQAAELNYGVLAFYDDILALAHAYPIICVYDDEGWNAEFPPQRGDITYADAAFFIVRITAPKGLALVTSGSEISLDEAGQAQALTVASGPARDFYLVASPNYEVVSKTVGEVTVHSYASVDFRDGANLALETAVNALRIFSERYAPYPYTELDIVATPNTALGIEYPGVIAITNRIYDVNGEFRDSPTRVYLESTVAHEVGHQWFYNLVGNDQLDDPWLDESLTQFATLQYFTDQYGAQGADGFRASLENRWAGIGNADIPIGKPVASYTGSEYGAIVYGRGPLFFETLKERIGADAFDAFLKEYTAQFSWRIAEPRSLQALVERHCDCDLQALFDEWVYP